MPDGLSLASTTAIFPTASMLAVAGPLDAATALVLAAPGLRSLDVLCGLIGRGCAAAAELPLDCKVPVEPAEILLVPSLTDAASVKAALSLSRRCLLPCGRIVLEDSEGGLSREIVALLRDVGFCNIRLHAHADSAIISADKPMFGAMLQQVGHG